MPLVKIFTTTENKRRDRYAKAMIRHGISESLAYARATALVKKQRKRKK